MDITSLLRENIRQMAPYSTARDEYEGDLGIYLDANENPFDNGFNRYPDPHNKRIRAKVSAMRGIPAEQIFVGGNGSDEPIDLLFRVFCEPRQDEALSIAPSYGMYRVAAATNDIRLTEVPLDADFRLSADALLAHATPRTKLLFLCSPNNPSGNLLDPEEVEKTIRNFGGIVVLDEAYIDFADHEGFLPHLSEFPNLVVLQTLSKAWGMAGIRIGFAFAGPEIVAAMERIKYPYSVNVITERLVLRELEREAIRREQIATLIDQRRKLVAALEQIPLIRRVFPSDANFVLVKVDEPRKIYNHLIERGIIVRDRSRIAGCEGCLRLTVGTPEENAALIDALQNPDQPFDRSTLPVGGGERCVTVTRKSRETDISVTLDLDNAAPSQISTGLGFFDHMLDQIVHHGKFSLRLTATGDLQVDEHHTIEDTALVLGEAFRLALGDKRGIGRYGFALPMDESRALVLLDFGGRIATRWDVELKRERIGDVPTEMFEHFFDSFAQAARCNLHIAARGRNEHHMIEGVFKAFARALRMAVERQTLDFDLPSSKGLL
ncbi:histidinol-phosphate transaminase [Millionella massiliensis]|uniref:histidinol-phosphate transaminase n=1 Tax=Millionella massiliensis TaxID=1871023 RepID=UPI0008D8EC6E|nr:histidinol-phosphate transaminase [Millionella massiliensis]